MDVACNKALQRALKNHNVFEKNPHLSVSMRRLCWGLCRCLLKHIFVTAEYVLSKCTCPLSDAFPYSCLGMSLIP